MSSMSDELKFLLFSHHPKCRKFENHTITILGLDLCIGCLAFYPTFLIVFITLFFNLIEIDYQNLIFLGLIQSSILLFNFLNQFRTKLTKFLSKMILGSGLAFVAVGILNLAYFELKIILLTISFSILVFLNFLRVKKMMRICKNCKQKYTEGCDVDFVID